jgi:hypothetical protein
MYAMEEGCPAVEADDAADEDVDEEVDVAVVAEVIAISSTAETSKCDDPHHNNDRTGVEKTLRRKRENGEEGRGR